MMALSIRQPWCWFILEGGSWGGNPLKDYENRQWDDQYAKVQMTLCPPGSDFLVHASAGMTHEEFDSACEFAAGIGATHFPNFDRLPRGGIVGVAKHHGLVRASASRWFTGPLALKLSDPYPLPLLPLKGRLGFFPFQNN